MQIHMSSKRTYDVKKSSLRQNDVATSFWRHNDVIITSCVRWVKNNSIPLQACSSNWSLLQITLITAPEHQLRSGPTCPLCLRLTWMMPSPTICRHPLQKSTGPSLPWPTSSRSVPRHRLPTFVAGPLATHTVTVTRPCHVSRPFCPPLGCATIFAKVAQSALVLAPSEKCMSSASRVWRSQSVWRCSLSGAGRPITAFLLKPPNSWHSTAVTPLPGATESSAWPIALATSAWASWWSSSATHSPSVPWPFRTFFAPLRSDLETSRSLTGRTSPRL